MQTLNTLTRQDNYQFDMHNIFPVQKNPKTKQTHKTEIRKYRPDSAILVV